MSKKIYKYELEITDHQFVEMPVMSRVLSAKEQNGKLCIWALVDPNMPMRKKNVQVIGTGNPIETNVSYHDWDFIDTVIMSYGLVWHVFADKL